MSVTTTLRTVLVIGLSFAAGAAVAQDGLRPLDPKGIDDVGGWLDEAETGTEAPPPRSDMSDPLAGPTGQGTTAPKPKELTPEERRTRDRQINRNYSKAQDIYQGIINSDKLEPLERRIANNERIVREYNQRIRKALGERRELQVQIFNQGFYLKQQVDRGQIGQAMYDQQITEEEGKYEGRVATLKRDVGLWRSEVKTAKRRLAELKAQRRMIMASRPKLRRKRGGKRGERAPKVRPGEKLMSSLRARLRKLDAFDTKHTLNGVHPRDLGSRPVLSSRGRDSAAPRGDASGGSLETPAEEDESFWED